ncbi:MAG: hypothetical protein OJF62_003151 [Pseudolabrys sp.]|nr:hypothetical protein [Pseudolabrys sp.]
MPDPMWRVVQTSFRCGRELQALLEHLKVHCTEQDYRHLSRGIAIAIDTLNTELTDRAIAMHPEYADRIESELRAHGHIR